MPWDDFQAATGVKNNAGFGPPKLIARRANFTR